MVTSRIVINDNPENGSYMFKSYNLNSTQPFTTTKGLFTKSALYRVSYSKRYTGAAPTFNTLISPASCII